jgi:hypothetical protein
MKRILLFMCLAAIPQMALASQSRVATVVWKEAAPAGATLAVVLVPEQPAIGNVDDVADDLGAGVPEESYLRFFKETFPEALREHSALGEVVFPPTPEMGQWQDRTLPLGKKVEARLRVPADRTTIITTPPAQFVLVIQNLQVSRQKGDWVHGGGFAPDGHHVSTNSRSEDKLVHLARFFLWDNRSGALVSYGWLNEEDKVQFPGMNRTTWTKVLRGMARSILRDSLLWVK